MAASLSAVDDSVVDLTLVLNVNVKVVLCQCGKAFRVPPSWEVDPVHEAGDEGRLVPVKEGKEEEGLSVTIARSEDGDSPKGPEGEKRF